MGWTSRENKNALATAQQNSIAPAGSGEELPAASNPVRMHQTPSYKKGNYSVSSALGRVIAFWSCRNSFVCLVPSRGWWTMPSSVKQPAGPKRDNPAFWW